MLKMLDLSLYHPDHPQLLALAKGHEVHARCKLLTEAFCLELHLAEYCLAVHLATHVGELSFEASWIFDALCPIQLDLEAR